MKKIQLPDISESEKTSLVKALLDVIELLFNHTRHQQEQIDALKDEVSVLKCQKKRPTFKASALDKSTQTDELKAGEQKTEPGKKRGKTKVRRPTDRNERVRPDDLPPGSPLHDIRPFHVQELTISKIKFSI